MDNVFHGDAPRRSRLMSWWYVCIAAGFVLLAISWALRGAGLFPVGLRVGIAIGFAALAYLEFQRQKR